MLISIIIPVYNGEKTIKSTIESVINQNYTDIELILVDGNSNDKTMNVVLDFRSYFDVIISESDEGYADAFNKGIKAAKGDYIMMLAADDWLLPSAIEKFKNSINQDTEVWCGSVIQKMSYCYRLRKSNADLENLRKWCSLENPASFYKRNLFDEYGYFDTSLKCAADRDMFLKLYLNGVKFQIEEFPIVIFERGGISTDDPEKYGLPEDEKVSIKYGLSVNQAKEVTKSLRDSLSRQKKLAPFKNFLSSIGLLSIFYKILGRGEGCLTKYWLIKLGVPSKKINNS